VKTKHKGYTITVDRSASQAGYSMLYWSIFRDSDDLECASGFEDSAETVRSLTGLLKQRVDSEVQEPVPFGEEM